MGQTFVAILGEVCSKERTAMEQSASFGDEATEDQSNGRMEVKRVERGGWIVNS